MPINLCISDCKLNASLGQTLLTFVTKVAIGTFNLSLDSVAKHYVFCQQLVAVSTSVTILRCLDKQDACAASPDTLVLS